MRPPLADIRILAIEQYGAGPWGSLHLADLGADVIKIEDPRSRGDVGRYVPPFQEGEDSLFFETFNRNKRSVSLDLTNPAGRRVFEDLVKESDAVYSNLRGDVPEKLRIRYEDLKHLKQSIVCCSLSAFGMTGPRASQPGYDYIVQGLAGWMSLTGEPSGPPTKTGLSLVDYSGGFVAALALLAGVHAAQRDGIGADCDVSLFDTAMSLLTYPATWRLNGEFIPSRTKNSAHPSVVPFQNFQTSDGWIVVACPKDKFWQRLTKVIGRPDLAADGRARDFVSRSVHRNYVLKVLDVAFAERTTQEWITQLVEAGVPAAAVNDVAGALNDVQTASRRLVIQTEHPHFGSVKSLSTAARVGSHPKAFRRAPRRGEDLESVLKDLLHYRAEEIDLLGRDGAFGAYAD